MNNSSANDVKLNAKKHKFDTQFFERYAKICLETILGEKYSRLENVDRPDLQDVFSGIGIEVTRAMDESKVAAIQMINEIAADDVLPSQYYSSKEFIKMGYSYGLVKSLYMAPSEYQYWSLAKPLKRIICNKVNKVINNFYGNFKEFGLFIFVNDEIIQKDVIDAMSLMMELQSKADAGFKNLFLYDAHFLFVCDISSFTFDKFCVSDELSNKFFNCAIHKDL